MSRHPYTLSLRWGSGPSAIVLTDIDFVVDIEVARPTPRDDFEVRIVALAIDGMRKTADGAWRSAVSGSLLMSRDPLLRAISDWAFDAILADEVFCAARIEEAREDASGATADERADALEDAE